MQTFGEKLIAARKRKGLTQEQLAQAVQVARNTISSWERNRTTPDVDSVRRLSEVLECDFVQDDSAPDVVSETASEPETAPVGPEPAEEASPEGIVSEEGTASPGAETQSEAPLSDGGHDSINTLLTPPEQEINHSETSRKRRKLPWIIAGAAVLVCLAVALGLHFRAAPGRFPTDFYRQETPNDPERAFLSFTSSIWEERTESSAYSRYDFSLNEHNGHPFSITRIEVRYDNVRGDDRTYILTADDLRRNNLEPDLTAYGSITLDGGFPKDEFARVGIVVYGEDADGTTNAFYHLIEL